MRNENTTDRNVTRATLTPDVAVMIEQSDGGWQKAASRTDWVHVASLTDHEIEDAAQSDPDAQPLGDDFWLNARVVVPAHALKRVIRGCSWMSMCWIGSRPRVRDGRPE